jgi:hypothetical protein
MLRSTFLNNVGFVLKINFLLMANLNKVPKEINNLLVSRKKLRGNYPIGVSKLNKKYLSQISLNGINHKIGIFNTIEEAFLKYKEAKEKQIQLLANKFKTKLNYKTYNSLMNYSIQINN